jgi:peroxiredoxin
MLQLLKTKKFWFSIVRDGFILIAVFYLINLYQTRNTPDIVPELQTQLMSGEQIDIKIMSKKSPLLLYFWGSWCPLCSFTSSAVTEIAKDYQVLTIALSSGDSSQVKQYLIENSYHFPVINDADGAISKEWGVLATPTFIIINKQGKISYITTGISTIWGLKFRLWLAS